MLVGTSVQLFILEFKLVGLLKIRTLTYNGGRIVKKIYVYLSFVNHISGYRVCYR